MSEPRGFIIREHEGRACPFVRCEHCGVEIHDIGLAGVVFDPGVYSGRDVSGVKVLCKVNHCLSLPEYRDQPWLELRSYLAGLLFNMGVCDGDAFQRLLGREEMAMGL